MGRQFRTELLACCQIALRFATTYPRHSSLAEELRLGFGAEKLGLALKIETPSSLHNL
jgi:hypothetical protein